MAKETPEKDAPRKRRARGSIDPEMILDGAYEMAEQGGLDNLSMPELASHLGVGVTSIYWHYRNKDALLRRMNERALAEIHEDAPNPDDWSPADWPKFLEAHFVHIRNAHRRSDLVTDITLLSNAVFSRESTQVAFGRVEEVLRYLVSAGFTLRNAYYVLSSCSMFQRGLVITERTQAAEQVPPTAGLAQLGLLDLATMPLLTQLVVEERVSIDMTGDELFLMGLRGLIEAAERIHAEDVAAAAG